MEYHVKEGKKRILVIHSGTTSIPEGAFRGWTSFDTVEFPSSLKVIEKDAFSGSTLSMLDMPGNVEWVQDGAFSNCTCLEHVHLAKGTVKIGEEVFAGCHKLKDLQLPKDLCEIPTGAFKYCFALNDIKVPESVRIIAPEAFSYCHATMVSLPDGLQAIGKDAFCKNDMTSIRIPPSVRYVGSNAFGECKYLKAVELSEKTKTFNAFCSCPELEDEHAGDENKVIESTLEKLFYFGLFALTVAVVSADCAELIVKHGDSAGQTIAVSAMELAVVFIGSTILVAFYQFLTENIFVSDRKCLNGNKGNEAYRLIDEFYGTGNLDFDGTAFLAQCFIAASAYVSIRLMWIGGRWATMSKFINPIIAFTVQLAGKVFENAGHPAVTECLFAAAILALQMKVAAMAMQAIHKQWVRTAFDHPQSEK